MNKIMRMIIVLAVIGLISGGILALVYQWSLPRIEENRVRETDAAVYKVLPDIVSYKRVEKDDLVYFKGFDKKGSWVGTAILCRGNGYQGEIKLMVGMDAGFTEFTGMAILEQVETPGLGAKIAENKFQEQFRGLAARPPVEYVKGRIPEKPNEIQAITGATISSRAVVDIINKAVKQWLEIQ